MNEINDLPNNLTHCLDCGGKLERSRMLKWHKTNEYVGCGVCPYCGRVYIDGKHHEPVDVNLIYFDDDERPGLTIS